MSLTLFLVENFYFQSDEIIKVPDNAECGFGLNG